MLYVFAVLGGIAALCNILSFLFDLHKDLAKRRKAERRNQEVGQRNTEREALMFLRRMESDEVEMESDDFNPFLMP